jgi:kynurenine formamidase
MNSIPDKAFGCRLSSNLRISLTLFCFLLSGYAFASLPVKAQKSQKYQESAEAQTVSNDTAARLRAATISVDFTGQRVVDLTHVLGPGLPDFHVGGEAFHYKKVFTVEKDGYANGSFCTVEHYGTHVDAPSHFFADGTTVDKLKAEQLIVPCVVIDVREQVKHNPDYRLTVGDIKDFEKKGPIPQHCGVLLLTGWAEKWDASGDYRHADKNGSMHFPGFDRDSATYLVEQRQAQCLGIDTLSIDAGTSSDYAAHKISLGSGIYLVENLNNLDQLPARGAWLIVAPLKVKDGTGSPARVFAFIQK